MSILLALLLIFFTNTDVMGKPTPVPSPSMGEGQGGGVPEATKVQVQETYGKLPLYFIPNDGQVDEKVKFYEKGSVHATYFTKEGVYISLVSGEKLDTIPPFNKGGQGGITSDLIKLTFLNANPNPEIIAVDLQEGKVNYFTGNDPKKWRTNIPTYSAVVYKEVYPGIDIKFYGNNRQMEYDIIVKPGADPSKVRFAYDGIEGLVITENGDLEIILKEGKIIQKKPVIYQEIDGNKVAIDGKFVITKHEVTSVIAGPQVSKQSISYIPSPLAGEGKGEGDSESLPSQFAYTFEIASYDKKHQLIIDPTLVYSTYIGGSNTDGGLGVAVDGNGNAYVTGCTYSYDFPATTGSYDSIFATFNGTYCDVFVAKLNAVGSSLAYATYIGGINQDIGYGIAVDSSGNAYVTGETWSTDFPTTIGAYDTTSNSSIDVFVVKLNTTGSSLTYATYIGGGSGMGIAVDGVGNAYVTGYTNSTDFPTSTGAYDTAYNGGRDAFVVKLNVLGSSLSYSTYVGGIGNDWGSAIAVEGSGNAYVTGQTDSSDFPVTLGAYDTTFNNIADAFVVKLDITGASLTYATYLGGSSSDAGYGIVVDGSGNAYVTGETLSADFPVTSGAYDTAFSGGPNDAFVVKINPYGASLTYASYIGGYGWEYGYGIAVNSLGNVYITGFTTSSDFPVTPGAYDTTFSGAEAFVVRLNAAGSLLSYATYLGGSDDDQGYGIALDVIGNAYVTGHTNSSDFSTTTGAYDTTDNAGPDAFVVKFSFPPAELPRTGQTTCYDSAGAVIACAGTGQDGEIQAGVPWPNPRFTDNGDSTVTDNLTGLMWTKDANLMTSRDPGFDTDDTLGDGAVTWQHALDYVAKLNAEAYLGYSDWRLPNINELESLIDSERVSPALQDNYPFINLLNGHYWSSTTYISYTIYAWVIYLNNGYVGGDVKSWYGYVYPVRTGQIKQIQLPRTAQTICYNTAGTVISCAGTGQDGEIQAGVPWPTPRFTDNGDGTVTDNLTDMMWTKNANLPGNAVAWKQALDYVSLMNLGSYNNFGYSDWRLPNRKELRSLIDYSRNTVGFPFINEQSNYGYWSSTSEAGLAYLAWGIGMGVGQVFDTYKSYPYYVWPVRSGQTECLMSLYYYDLDGDTYGNVSATIQACTQPSGYVSNSSDCNDNNASVNPGATEVCNGVDDNCNSQTDEGVQNTYYQDSDNDTYGNASIITQVCTQPSGYVSNSSDCNDGNASINPGAIEVCNGMDDNCNGQTDEGVQNIYYRDLDNDTYGNVSVTTQACTQPSGYVSNSSDCNDNNASFNPGATEVCNSVDDNCNGQVDEGFALSTYYRDADNDTYGNALVTTQACTQPSGYALNSTDCNDGNVTINPGATEVCNGVDDNCNGQVDEGFSSICYPGELPRTGQTISYALGDDGDIQSGMPWPVPRFTDNGNGTATDNLTGLMWTKDAGTPIVGSCTGGGMTWQQALDYVSCLNSNSYLGYTDWRLPNVNELESLTNKDIGTATWLNTQGFSNVYTDPYTSTIYYWSSTSNVSFSPVNAWVIDMLNGNVGARSKSDSNYVWPVRSGQVGMAQVWKTGQTTCYDTTGNVIACTGTGQDGDIKAGVAWPSPRFADNGNGTVTDNLTGLVWTKNAGTPSVGSCTGEHMTWQQALDYVACLNANSYLGYTDWRLPNLKELYSLNDFSRAYPTLSSGHPFLLGTYSWAPWIVCCIYYWSSTSAGPYHAWIGDIGYGRTWPTNKSPNDYGYYVWPVRSGYLVHSILGTVTENSVGLSGVTMTLGGDVSTTTTTASDGTYSFTGLTDGNYTITPGLSGYTFSPPSRSVTMAGADVTAQDFSASCVQNTYYRDADNDTYGNASVTTQACTQPSGYVTNSSDCNDSNASINPGAAEVCNGVDDNCNSQIDEGLLNTYYRDADGDAYGNSAMTTQACTQPSGYVSNNTDCNDSNASVKPGATEVCNGIDDNCNGQVDEGMQNTYYRDADNDTYGNASVSTQACTQPAGYVTNSSDCNDGSASINPGATEICNSIDDNCDGLIDEGCSGVEVCDGMDNDNDGQIDEGFPDTDGDGNADCVDTDDDNDGVTDVNEISAGSDPLNAASTPEVCDGVDNDMDGLTDEGCPGSPATPEGTNVEIIPTENLTLTFDNVTTSGTTTVTPSGTGQPPPSGFRLGSPPVYYEITTTATYSGPIQVCLSYDETQFATERSLRLFHLESGIWVDITDPGYPDTINNIICGNTMSFSPFIVVESSSSSSSTPTIVSGVSLSARMDGDHVVLTWSTGSERDNEGFIILRGESAAGPFSSITSAMIPATGGFGMRATYTFTDSRVEQGKTYYYRLQDIDSRGKVTTQRVVSVNTAVAGGERPSQKIQDQKQDIQSISQEIEKKSGKGGGDEGSGSLALIPDERRDAEEEVSSHPHPASPVKGEGYSEPPAEMTGVIALHDNPDYHLNPPSPPFGKGGNLEMGGRGVAASGPSSFSVSIEDDKGNIIVVSKIEDTAGTATQTRGIGFTKESGQDSRASGQSDRPEGLSLQVKEEAGRIVLTWKGRGGTKGFILHRTEKGKENYTAITGLIPYFGREDKDIFLYKFTDTNIKPEVQYDYRLEVVKSDQTDRTAQR